MAYEVRAVIINNSDNIFNTYEEFEEWYTGNGIREAYLNDILENNGPDAANILNTVQVTNTWDADRQEVNRIRTFVDEAHYLAWKALWANATLSKNLETEVN